jgi:hypothetical protein
MQVRLWEIGMLEMAWGRERAVEGILKGVLKVMNRRVAVRGNVKRWLKGAVTKTGER